MKNDDKVIKQRTDLNGISATLEAMSVDVATMQRDSVPVDERDLESLRELKLKYHESVKELDVLRIKILDLEIEVKQLDKKLGCRS